MGNKVLVVDDDECNVRSLAKFFEERGDAMHVAREPEEAEALLENAPYSLVVADSRVGRVGAAHGDVVSCAKRTFARTRVILFSDGAERDGAEPAVDAFLAKPIRIDALEALVDLFFRRAS
jgi:DNA-binding response OmpR family regulator